MNKMDEKTEEGYWISKECYEELKNNFNDLKKLNVESNEGFNKFSKLHDEMVALYERRAKRHQLSDLGYQFLLLGMLVSFVSGGLLLINSYVKVGAGDFVFTTIKEPLYKYVPTLTLNVFGIELNYFLINFLGYLPWMICFIYSIATFRRH